MSALGQPAPSRQSQFLGSTRDPGLHPALSRLLRSTPAASLRHRQAHKTLQAQRPRQESWRDDDYVELDDEEDWQDEVIVQLQGLELQGSFAKLFSVPSRCCRIQKAAQAFKASSQALFHRSWRCQSGYQNLCFTSSLKGHLARRYEPGAQLVIRMQGALIALACCLLPPAIHQHCLASQSDTSDRCNQTFRQDWHILQST